MISLEGVVLALKDIGSFLGLYTFWDVAKDPQQFTWSFIIFLLINLPTDLFVGNRIKNNRSIK